MRDLIWNQLTHGEETCEDMLVFDAFYHYEFFVMMSAWYWHQFSLAELSAEESEDVLFKEVCCCCCCFLFIYLLLLLIFFFFHVLSQFFCFFPIIPWSCIPFLLCDDIYIYSYPSLLVNTRNYLAFLISLWLTAGRILVSSKKFNSMSSFPTDALR